MKRHHKLYLDIYVNGRFKATHTLCAEKLHTLGPEWVSHGTACGDGSRMRIDLQAEIQ